MTGPDKLRRAARGRLLLGVRYVAGSTPVELFLIGRRLDDAPAPAGD